MIQHNLYKIHNLQTKYIRWVLWGFGFILIIVSRTIKSLDYQTVSTVIGAVAFLSGILISLFNNKLWKCNFFQKIMRMTPFEDYWTPIIEGRWKGTLIRNGESHDFVLEIIQNFTSISCTSYTHHSSSNAFATEILYDKQSKLYKLAFCWHGQTRNAQKGTGDSNIFDGFTILNIAIEDGQPHRLWGEYFTNRQPNQTKGFISLKLQSKTLQNTFAYYDTSTAASDKPAIPDTAATPAIPDTSNTQAVLDMSTAQAIPDKATTLANPE